MTSCLPFLRTPAGTARLLLTGIMLVLVTACQSGGDPRKTALTAVKQIHSITLNHEFTIRADRASEYIQDGEFRQYDKISEYYPHCIFGLRAITDSAHTIQPDTFSVHRIHLDQIVRGFVKMMVAGDGDYGFIMSTTDFYLHSDRQPEVFRLTCQQLDAAFEARHVTFGEMQQTLGKLFTLVQADNPPPTD